MNTTLLACALLACVAIATALPASRDERLVRRLLHAIAKKGNGRRELKQGDGSEDGCGILELQCTSGAIKCIEGLTIDHDSYECDGELDCADFSDEIGCYCPDPDHDEYFKDRFQCANGVCTFLDKVCNGNDDCGDNSDEQNCNSCSGEDDFKCDNGKCIGAFITCDGYDDCGDNSDEKELVCPACSGEDDFKCDNGKCIGAWDTCDWYDDCGDNSDEKELICPEKLEKRKNCKPGQSTCRHGK